MAARTKPSPLRRERRSPAGRRGVGSALGAALALLLACAPEPEADPTLPSGAALVARTAALTGVLADLHGLADTPLARWAAQVLEAMPECPIVEGHADSGGLARALTGMGCGAVDGPLSLLHERLGSNDLTASIQIEGSGHARAAARRRADGSLDVELWLPRDAFRGPTRLLVPSSDPPGPEALSPQDRLVHARVRAAEALDVASWVRDGSQGADLFALQSALFSGAVLDGTWELAVYPPEPGRRTPLAALALGFTQRAAAVAALEAFLAELRETWPMPRSPFAVGDAEGACLLELNLLPGLAPCYVAGERWLVVGWSPASVRKALDRIATTEERLTSSNRLVVELARFTEIDARLAQLTARADPLPPLVWPWRRLVARAHGTEAEVRLEVELETGGPGT